MRKHNKVGIIISLLLVICLTGGLIGYYIAHNKGYQDVYLTGYNNGYNLGYSSHIEYRDIVKYVDRVVVQEVVIEKPIELREFASLQELKDWLVRDDTDKVVLISNKEGVISLADIKHDPRFDCEDYAYQLQKRALADGYLMSMHLVSNPKPHMQNLVFIGNKIYIIEPQNDRIISMLNQD